MKARDQIVLRACAGVHPPSYVCTTIYLFVGIKSEKSKYCHLKYSAGIRDSKLVSCDLTLVNNKIFPTIEFKQHLVDVIERWHKPWLKTAAACAFYTSRSVDVDKVDLPCSSIYMLQHLCRMQMLIGGTQFVDVEEVLKLPHILSFCAAAYDRLQGFICAQNQKWEKLLGIGAVGITGF